MKIEIDARELVREVVAAVREHDDLRRELVAALGHEEQRGLVSPAEFARRNSIATSTVRKAIRDGRLDAVRIGRAVRIAADAVISPRSVVTRDTATVAAERRLGLIVGGRK